MKIITAYFNRQEIYKKLYKVFKKSAREIMPIVELKILKIKPPNFIDHQRDAACSFLNVVEYIYKNNDKYIVTGIDSLFLRPVNNIFQKKFDIAISVRNHKVKYNTGLWAYNDTPKAKLFLRSWIGNTKLLVKKYDDFENIIRNYGGIDQLSLIITMIEDENNTHIKELPCQEWNATQSEWMHIDNKTRMVHIKSQLRILLSEEKEIKYNRDNRYLKPIIEKWRSYL